MRNLQHNLLAAHTLPGFTVLQALFLHKLKSYMDESLDNTDLNGARVAKAMEMSKSTLNRRLKEVLNMTISEFIKLYRLQWAADILLAGYKVKEVSRQVGFKSPSYFAHCFRLYYGKAPSEYSNSLD